MDTPSLCGHTNYIVFSKICTLTKWQYPDTPPIPKTFLFTFSSGSKMFLRKFCFNVWLSFTHFEFKTRLLLAQFGFTERLLFGNFVRMQDFQSNFYLNKAFKFLVTIIILTFHVKFGFKSRLSWRHCEFETNVLLVEFGLETRLLLRNLVSHQHFKFHSNF